MSKPKIQTIFKSQVLKDVSDAPRQDLERILLHVLQRSETAWLYAHAEARLSVEQAEEFERLIAERATGKPLAYVLGEWEFWGRPFYVTPDVLVPRPATEELIDAALAYIRPEMTVADIGTGSGIIAITLALEGPALRVLATDISAETIEVAKKNARRHGVADRIRFLLGDMLRPLSGKKVDLIVSNPPYVPTRELESHFAKSGRDESETQGLRFEPRIALDGGPDGQDFIRQIEATKIPAIVETTGGAIQKFNF